MENLGISLIGIVCLFVFLSLGVHIGFSLMLSGFIGLYLIKPDIAPIANMVIASFYTKITMPVLIVLPLFIIMGYLASGGGISQNIYNSLSLWVGKFKSGLGVATVLACTAFGTVCGSSLVTAAVFTKISAPEMRRYGYDKKLAYAICASAGAIGMLIPPSMLAVVYAILSGQSIGKILMAGVAPGLLLTVGFSLCIYLIGIVRPSSMQVPEIPAASWGERLNSLKDWWSVIIVAFCIFGGMYGGIFSPSEAAAVAAFILFVIYILMMLFGKQLREKSRELMGIFYETVVTSAMVFLVLGAATVFSSFITMSGMSKWMLDTIMNYQATPMIIVIIILVFILFLGCFLDSTSILCITIPIFNPIIAALGVNPIWYATCVITATEIGLITPPFGMNVFATFGAAEPDVTMEDIFAGIVPFLIVMFLVLVLLFVFPPLGTYFPSMVE